MGVVSVSIFVPIARRRRQGRALGRRATGATPTHSTGPVFVCLASFAWSARVLDDHSQPRATSCLCSRASSSSSVAVGPNSANMASAAAMVGLEKQSRSSLLLSSVQRMLTRHKLAIAFHFLRWRHGAFRGARLLFTTIPKRKHARHCNEWLFRRAVCNKCAPLAWACFEMSASFLLLLLFELETGTLAQLGHSGPAMKAKAALHSRTERDRNETSSSAAPLSLCGSNLSLRSLHELATATREPSRLALRRPPLARWPINHLVQRERVSRGHGQPTDATECQGLQPASGWSPERHTLATPSNARPTPASWPFDREQQARGEFPLTQAPKREHQSPVAFCF